MARLTFWTVAFTAFLANTSLAKDPLRDFCRRFAHQTAVIDNKLFIDGGFINYNPLAQNPNNVTNTGLLYADLKVDNQGMPMEYANLSKPQDIPSVSGGALFPDTINKKFYLYGGEFANDTKDFGLYSYDALYNNWSTVTPDPSQSAIQRASFGAHTVLQDRGVAYWYGGYLSNSSVRGWNGGPVALSNLLSYDMVNNIWVNMTGPDSIGRAEGIMIYLPVSDGGMLAYIGGVTQDSGNSTVNAQPMNEILLYDVANSRWYNQRATGDVPGVRRRFCGGLAVAPDRSSLNIYIYGGGGFAPDTTGYDDVYILTLPSFTWVKWFPDASGTTYPHHSGSCNVINGNQMLVMGGTYPNSTICDVPTVFGFHNLDMGQNNYEQAKWYKFQKNVVDYKVPPALTNVIGGTAKGGATRKQPIGGYSSSDLDYCMNHVYKASTTRAPTRSVTKFTGIADHQTNTSKGTIIGAAVGGGVGAILIIAAIAIFCIKRRNNKAADAQRKSDDSFMNADPMLSADYYNSHTPLDRQQQPVQLPTDEMRTREPIELDADAVPKHGAASPTESQKGLATATARYHLTPQPTAELHGDHMPAPYIVRPPAYSSQPQYHDQPRRDSLQASPHASPQTSIPPQDLFTEYRDRLEPQRTVSSTLQQQRSYPSSYHSRPSPGHSSLSPVSNMAPTSEDSWPLRQ